jgi:hypothetical protein
MNSATYEAALTVVNTSWSELNALLETDPQKWADLSQQITDLVHRSTYEFKTHEFKAGERILMIQTPRFHPTSRHYGKKMGDLIHWQLTSECGAEMSWNGYWVQEEHADKAKNTIWQILNENDALDLL